MKRMLWGIMLAVMAFTILAVSSERRSDVTQIRTIDGDLISMLMLERYQKYLYNSEYESHEQVFDHWFRPDESTDRKSPFPKPYELLVYQHVFGPPKTATKHYTYLVANAALSNTFFQFDSDDLNRRQTDQNRSIIKAIVNKAEQGDADAKWVVDEISRLRNFDIATWRRN